jgi:hypothetical protein
LSAFRREKYSKVKEKAKEMLKLKAMLREKVPKAITREMPKERTTKPNQTTMGRTGKQWACS